MTPRTVPPVPLDDRRMRRLFLARLHEDAGGSHELSLYGQALYEAATERASQGPTCSKCPQDGYSSERGAGDDGIVREDGRVPFPECADFEDLTRRALKLAEEVESIFAKPLRLLHDCLSMEWLAREQERGASFKQLASIGYAVGMSGVERGRWYEIAKSVPLSQRHAGHIISKLKGRG